jgi:acyl-CoA synthetase (NDP forming)
MQNVSALGAFFQPNSVAVVGASSDPKKLGHTVLKNLIAMGYRGKIFPVNPREDLILGLRCWRSLLEVPEPVEICALIVAADRTLQVAAEMAQRKKRYNDILGAICMSAGFAELPAGEARQRELVDILRSASIRLIGPNCLGIIDTGSGFNTNFDISTYAKGGLSILSQSGALGNSFLLWAREMRLVGLSKYASIGNMADVTMAELLRFLKDDASTRVIGVYLEGLSDPEKFFDAAREVTPVKPIVMLKAGRSAQGAVAARYHTGSIAGADAVYDRAFKQTGILRARTVAEFCDTMRAFERQPVPDGGRVCIVTHMGGPGTICVDEISTIPDLELARLSPEIRDALKSVCPPMANIGHPDGYVDLTGAHTEKLYSRVLNIILREKNADLFLQLIGPSVYLDQKQMAEEIAGAYEAQPVKKPFLNAVTFGHSAREIRQRLEDAGILTVEHPDTLARIAGNMAAYGKFRRKAVTLTKADKNAARKDAQLT